MGSFAWWGLAALLVALASRSLGDFSIRYRYVVVAGIVGLLMLRMFDVSARIELRYRTDRLLPEYYGTHFYDHYPFNYDTTEDGFPPVPADPLEQLSTKPGVAVYLPKTREGTNQGLVWDSTLPASQDFNPNLAYRKPGDLSRGFKAQTPPGELPWAREVIPKWPQ